MGDSFLEQAVDLAVESVAIGGGPFGALVVRGGRVVGRGANRVVLDGDPTAHAEVLAIRAACAELGTHDLSGCTLYASCEPCPMCRGAIQWARIASVHHAATREDAAAAGFDDRRFFEELVTGGGTSAPDDEVRRLGQRAFDAWRAHAERVDY